MTTEIKVRKRYISLLTICLIIFAINLFFSSSSQTNIIQHNETKKANLTKQDIAELIIEESEKDRQKTINKPDFIIKKGSINSKPMYCELRDHNIDSIEILQLAKDFKDVFDFKRSRKGDEYDLWEETRQWSIEQLENIYNELNIDIGKINKRVILIAKKLSPEETSQLQLERIKGFVTDQGGYSSHTSIIARTLEIPAVLGVANATINIKNDDLLIINGITGMIIINPDDKHENDKKR